MTVIGIIKRMSLGSKYDAITLIETFVIMLRTYSSPNIEVMIIR